MSIQSTRAREKLVLSIHFTLYPGVDDNFIRFIQTTPRRNLPSRRTSGRCGERCQGDQVNSTTVTANADGSFQSEVRYSAYGEVRHADGTTVTDKLYTGHTCPPEGHRDDVAGSARGSKRWRLG